MREQIRGLWGSTELIKEVISLSKNFTDYKAGLVKIPGAIQSKSTTDKMTECTFAPVLNEKSRQLEEN